MVKKTDKRNVRRYNKYIILHLFNMDTKSHQNEYKEISKYWPFSVSDI